MRKMITLALFAAFAGTAMADVEIYNGDTTGGSTYNRPLGGTPPTSLSGVGTAVRYEVVPMYTNFNASVIFETIDPTAFDTFISLYGPGGFDPANPLANAISADDDAGVGVLSLITSNINGGTQYYVVVTGFGNTDFGTYTLSLSSTSADITIGLIPAPGALAVLGLGGLVATRRRRA